MVSSCEATLLIYNTIQNLLSGSLVLVEKTPIQNSVGMVLMEDIYAERAGPPFSRATMDGIAVKYSQLLPLIKDQLLALQIVGERKAGFSSEDKLIVNGNQCIEIMTGGPIPNSCDMVIPYEYLEKIENGHAFLSPKVLSTPLFSTQNYHQFIAWKGSDYLQGQLLLPQGTLIRSPEVGIMAAQGKNAVLAAYSSQMGTEWTWKEIKIALITTGDELVENISDGQISPPGSVGTYQIRSSNRPVLMAELASHRFKNIKHFHFIDDKEIITQGLTNIFNEYFVIILVGGLSKGKYDFVPKVLKDLGTEKIFQWVLQRPGKPFYFGRKKAVKTTTHENTSELNINGQLVFGLPGNPLASIICLRRYVIPALNQISNLTSIEKFTTSSYSSFSLIKEADLKQYSTKFKDGNLTYFLPVKIKEQKGDKILVEILDFHNSGDYLSLKGSDGFIEVNPTTITNERQDHLTCPFYPWGKESNL